MSIAFTGGGRVQRVTAIPSLASAFSACGFVKLSSAPSGYGAFFELFKGTSPQQQLTVGHEGGGTDLAAYVNFTGSGGLVTMSTGWVWIAIRSTGGTVTVASSLLASGSWDDTTDFTLSTDFAPTHLTLGGNIYGENAFNTLIFGWKVWNEARSLADLLTQKASLTAVSASGILSAHDMDGPDLAADLVADTGGATANLTAEGIGISYDAAQPTLGASTPVSITGGGDLPLSAPASSTVPPWVVRFNRRFRR
jgi:hypothetical protein